MGIIKETVFETCGACQQRRRVADEVRGCDVCKKVFGDNDPYLPLGVFNKDDRGSAQLDCCSWDCVFKVLPTIESDYFVSLPYLHYDYDTAKGQRASDFFAALQVAAQPTESTKD